MVYSHLGRHAWGGQSQLDMPERFLLDSKMVGTRTRIKTKTGEKKKKSAVDWERDKDQEREEERETLSSYSSCVLMVEKKRGWDDHGGA